MRTFTAYSLLLLLALQGVRFTRALPIPLGKNTSPFTISATLSSPVPSSHEQTSQAQTRLIGPIAPGSHNHDEDKGDVDSLQKEITHLRKQLPKLEKGVQRNHHARSGQTMPNDDDTPVDEFDDGEDDEHNYDADGFSLIKDIFLRKVRHARHTLSTSFSFDSEGNGLRDLRWQEENATRQDGDAGEEIVVEMNPYWAGFAGFLVLTVLGTLAWGAVQDDEGDGSSHGDERGNQREDRLPDYEPIREMTEQDDRSWALPLGGQGDFRGSGEEYSIDIGGNMLEMVDQSEAVNEEGYVVSRKERLALEEYERIVGMVEVEVRGESESEDDSQQGTGSQDREGESLSFGEELASFREVLDMVDGIVAAEARRERR